MELVVDNTEEFLKDLFSQMIDNGHTTRRAEELVLKKVAIEKNKEYKSFKKNVKVPIFLPLEDVGTREEVINNPDMNKMLFKAGFDTIGAAWFIDVCCYKWREEIRCGEIILGTERLDKKWFQSGNASDDAYYFVSREVLQEGMKR